MTTDVASEAATGVRAAEENPDLLRLFNDWNQALKSKIPERVADLYAPNAILVPTRSNDIRSTRGEIVQYFQKFLVDEPSAELVRPFLGRYGDTPTNSGIYKFTFGDGSTALARYTFVYVWHVDRWLIATHHSSVLFRPAAGEEALARIEF